MKKRKSLQYYGTILLTATLLNGCSRPEPPVESYTASDAAGEGQADTAPAGQQESAVQAEAASDETAQAEFDAFTDRIFREILAEDPLSLHFMLKCPESFGISQPEMKFPEISAAALQADTADNAALQKELSSFSTTQLTPEQLFTYRMLQDMLDTEQLSEELELYYQPISPTIGVQAQLPVLLAEYTFYERDDVDHYLELLSQIDTYYEQLEAYEKERAASGLTPSDATLDRIIQSCKDYLIRPENSFLTETFASRLEEVRGLTEKEREEYKAKHLTILKEDFIPAYTNLSQTLEELKGQGTNSGGLCSYPEGKQYYSYLVASETGTDSTVEELKDRILKRLSSDVAEITLLVQNQPELQNQLSDAGIRLTDPDEILKHLQKQITEDFPTLPNAQYQVKHVPQALESSLSPAFFLVPPLDSENTNVIYINDNASSQQNLYTMLAHEGYPGHLYQSVYFNRKNQCPLRRLLTCDGYSEGWGMYSELYSYSFDNGLSKEAQKLMTYSESSIYGLYALLDIYINYDGWDLEKTSRFLDDCYGISDPEVVQEMYQSMIDNPCNYLKYYTGYLEICTLRASAMDALGSRYTPKSFHKFILDMDGASFRVIKPYFETWLLTFDMNAEAEG